MAWPNTYEHKGKHLTADVRDEVIHIKGAPDHVEQVVEVFHRNYIETHHYQTIHGPIVSHSLFETHNDQHIALSSISIKSRSSTSGVAMITTASSWKEFVDAVEKVETPTLNVVYADVHGNIGYYVTGAIPRRDNNVIFEFLTVINGYLGYWSYHIEWMDR